VTEVPRIPHSDLRIRAVLGAGGQATVHLVELAAGPGELLGRPLAYKEYRPEALPELNTPALDALIALPHKEDAQERGWLTARAAWPLAEVTRDGAVCGLLMAPAPDEFSAGQRVQGLEFLLNPPEYLARIGLAVTEQQRLRLLDHLVGTIGWLHARGAAVGDLSPKNILVSLAPEPRTFLIDCDGVCLRGATVQPQMDTPDWALPPGEPPGTVAGDRLLRTVTSSHAPC
jgi:DNA-binding helix-hairpin-helix protein with protein kinase domain